MTTMAPNHRSLKIIGIIIGVACAAGVALWIFALRPIARNSRLSRQISEDISSLLANKPPRISNGQWEFMVGWTLNLHGNCGCDPFAAQFERMSWFAEHLRNKMACACNDEMIDWIWDEYGRFAKNGPVYSEYYRPTTSPHLINAKEGCFGFHVEERAKTERGILKAAYYDVLKVKNGNRTYFSLQECNFNVLGRVNNEYHEYNAYDLAGMADIINNCGVGTEILVYSFGPKTTGGVQVYGPTEAEFEELRTRMSELGREDLKLTRIPGEWNDDRKK
jgi:hypothetical protein